MARRPSRLPRGLVFTLALGLTALAAVYYAEHAHEWDTATRVILALGFLTFAGVLFYAEWLSRKTAGR